ncbi:SDR family oxidoreductase [Sphingobium sp.]|uniref:SDR family NAD(P)-dependent oxidoreductase n=1 Tax=Sphingobium sp. TaxID=1912891 RepID=UPI0028BEF3CF|nr:SDR family oxidoreductase [Sphingobium sp.]
MLQDKVIIVTGAASGIGRASAVRFAELGAYVVAVDRLPAVEATAAAIARGGGKVKYMQADISDEAQVKAFVDLALNVQGRLDGAFNNAGVIQKSSQLHEIDLAEWRRVNAINTDGTFLCVKHEINAMLQTGGGAIVNTSSVLGQIAVALNGAYTASKHAVIGITRSAAIEYSGRGIRVNAILPGAIETDMFRAGRNDPQTVAQIEAIEAAHPIGRVAQPVEVSEIAAWLLSDASSYVTGTAIPVDGGYTAA